MFKIYNIILKLKIISTLNIIFFDIKMAKELLYIEFLPDELVKLIAFHADSVSSVNKLYTFRVFKKLYNDPYFFTEFLQFNMTYLVQIFNDRFGSNIFDKISNYNKYLIPAYQNAIKIFNKHVKKTNEDMVLDSLFYNKLNKFLLNAYHDIRNFNLYKMFKNSKLENMYKNLYDLRDNRYPKIIMEISIN